MPVTLDMPVTAVKLYYSGLDFVFPPRPELRVQTPIFIRLSQSITECKIYEIKKLVFLCARTLQSAQCCDCCIQNFQEVYVYELESVGVSTTW